MKTGKLMILLACVLPTLLLSGCYTTAGGPDGYYSGYHGGKIARYLDPGLARHPSRQQEGLNPFPSGGSLDALDKALDADLEGNTPAADRHRQAVLELEKTRSQTATTSAYGGYGYGGGAVGMPLTGGYPRTASGDLQYGVIYNAQNCDCQVWVDGKAIGVITPEANGGFSYFARLSLAPGSHHLRAVRLSDGREMANRFMNIDGTHRDNDFNNCPVDFKQQI